MIQSENIRLALTSLFDDVVLKKELLDNSETLITAGDEHIRSVVIEYFYKAHLNQIDFDKSLFVKALKDREVFSREIEALQQSGNSTSTLELYKRVFDFTGQFYGVIANIAQAIKLVLIQKPVDQQTLVEFLKNYSVYKLFVPRASERILKRFATSFKNEKRFGPSEVDRISNSKVAFLNTIMEFVLVSTGILSSDLFKLKKTDLSAVRYDETKKALSEVAIDLDKILKDYSLHGKGVFFYNRWDVQGKKQTDETDEWVRNFMRRVIARDSDEFFKMFNYEDSYRRLQEIWDNKELKKAEREFKLKKLIAEIFQNEGFLKIIIKFIKEKWYKDIFEK